MFIQYGQVTDSSIDSSADGLQSNEGAMRRTSGNIGPDRGEVERWRGPDVLELLVGVYRRDPPRIESAAEPSDDPWLLVSAPEHPLDDGRISFADHSAASRAS